MNVAACVTVDLAVLVCPVTRSSLRWDTERHELISDVAGLAYPVRDGVPVLIAREARPLHSDDSLCS